MSEELKLYLIVTIKNILTILGFIVLAIVFHKWGLSLLSALFYTSVEKKEEKKEEH